VLGPHKLILKSYNIWEVSETSTNLSDLTTYSWAKWTLLIIWEAWLQSRKLGIIIKERLCNTLILTVPCLGIIVHSASLDSQDPVLHLDKLIPGSCNTLQISQASTTISDSTPYFRATWTLLVFWNDWLLQSHSQA
jgi:hypothetical protein